MTPIANIIYSNCQVTVTLQLLKMTLESVETSSKSFIIIINFIVKSITNQQLIRRKKESYQKHIRKLLINDIITTDPLKILKEQECFYNKLYKSNSYGPA